VLLPTKNLAKREKNLIGLFKGLSQQDQDSLLAFAEFLSQRANIEVEADPVSSVKIDIPRPDEERVVAAIKRLSSSYPMLDRSLLLTETSSLMTAHVMHGRAAKMVIDELEVLFAGYYDKYCQEQS